MGKALEYTGIFFDAWPSDTSHTLEKSKGKCLYDFFTSPSDGAARTEELSVFIRNKTSRSRIRDHFAPQLENNFAVHDWNNLINKYGIRAATETEGMTAGDAGSTSTANNGGSTSAVSNSGAGPSAEVASKNRPWELTEEDARPI